MSSLKERIEEGLLGKYKGLNNGFNRLNNYIFGVQRGTKTLIGGDSGCGKTSLLDFIILNALEDAIAKGIEIDIFYDSWEIKELDKKCNWCSQIVFNKYGIVIPPERIKGLGDNRLSADEKTIVFDELDYVDELFDKIHFSWSPVNPTGLYNRYWKFASEKGDFTYEPYVDSEGITKQKIIKWTPKNPDAYMIGCLDHLFYLRKERGFETKQVIDKYSEYCVELSNMFGYSFFNISQFNDGLSAIDRQKFKGVDLSPSKTDFKDSRNPYQDGDCVIGLLNPFKLDMKTCLGYDVDKFGKKLIMLKILKNRLSEDGVGIGLYFRPEAGRFEELPKSEEFKKNPKLYEQYGK